MKAVIFDMDGVIIDSEPIHFEVDMQTMREFGVNISKDELNKYVGTTNEYMLNDLINKYKIHKHIYYTYHIILIKYGFCNISVRMVLCYS